MPPTATAEYQELEDVLVGWLDAALDDIDVIAYPESNTLPTVKQSGLLIVGDAGDSVGDPSGRYMGGSLPTEGSYRFTLDLYVKNLRGPHGVCEVIRKIREATNGKQAAPSSSPLSLTRFVYRSSRPVAKSETSKVWNYQIELDANYKLMGYR